MSRRDGRPFDSRRLGYEDIPNRSLMSSKSMQLLEIARGNRINNDERYRISPGPVRNRVGYRDDPYSNKRRNNFSNNSNNYYLDEEPLPLIRKEPVNKPPPLIPPGALEQLRAGLRATSNRFESEAFGQSRVFTDESSFDADAYTREEEDTRKTIEEIISVAQALREKMDREEELRREEMRREELRREELRRQELVPIMKPLSRPIIRPEPDIRPKRIEEIPSLLDLKPTIPSLLDIYVPPPDVDNVMQENIMLASRHSDAPDIDICWNGDEIGDRYTDCNYPKMRNFCLRCGKRGFDVTSCPCSVIYD